jgi:surface protein
MTLYNVVEKLKLLALKHPNVNSAYEGNIYDYMNANPQLKYATVVLTQQSHTQEEMYEHYNFNIFYVDRLSDNLEDNRLSIQSSGKSLLSNIIKAFCDEFDAEYERINFQPFTEKFADECAGVYATLSITMLKDIYCTEKYWDESWSTPLITIKNQNKNVEFTENGSYTIDFNAEKYTGLGKVSVEVNVPDLNGSFDDGYNEGKIDGREEGYTEGYIDGKEKGTEEGYSQGYTEGKTDGFEQGKDEGIAYQKTKLESISITENGTYSKEDGYNNITVNVPDLNGSFDEGYSVGYEDGVEEGITNAGAIIAETAQVMNITENGLYTTQYTKVEDFNPQITGYFEDGTPFYDYAHLTKKSFDTELKATLDSELELWWKPDFNYRYIMNMASIFSEKNRSFNIYIDNNGVICAQIGDSFATASGVDKKWYHFKLSTANGFWIDDVKVADMPKNGSVSSLYIASINLGYAASNANGYFGMVKFDGNTYIPTENGFVNYTTNTPLNVNTEGSYEFTGLPKFEGNLARTINVNVPIRLKGTNIKLGYSDFKEVPDFINFEGVTDMSEMFYSCSQLTTFSLDTSNVSDMGSMFYGCSSLTTISKLDTSNVTSMNNMFNYCTSLTTIPQLNTSNVTDMRSMLYNCSKLTTIPLLDTSNVSDMYQMFSNCGSLTTIPQLDTSNVTNMSQMFYGCTSLVSVPPLNASKVTYNMNYGIFGYSNMDKLTDFGGLIGLKASMAGSYSFDKVPNLTYESCINILNGLYDFTGNGEQPTSNEGKLKVHKNFLDKVGEEISIASIKGWTITA